MDWMAEASDERLFAAHCGGDAEAFAALFRRYQEPLCRHLDGMLHDRAQAEDLVLETFVRVHRHRHRFRAETKLRPWIYTIARNLARNRRRRERLGRWLPLAAAEHVAVEHAPAPSRRCRRGSARCARSGSSGSSAWRRLRR